MIELEPHIEQRLREEAARRGQDAAAYVKSIVEERLGLNAVRPFYATATKEEWLRAFNAWIDSHDPNLPPLAEEAFSRETIYGDRGL